MQRYNRGKNTHATVVHKRTCCEKNPTPAMLEGYLNLHKIQAKKRRAQKTATSYEQTNERRTFFVCLKSSLSQQPFRSAILPGHRVPLSTYTSHTHVAIIKTASVSNLHYYLSRFTSAANFPIFCLHASNTCGNGTQVY